MTHSQVIDVGVICFHVGSQLFVQVLVMVLVNGNLLGETVDLEGSSDFLVGHGILTSL